MAVTPLLALLVLFVLWAGRSARASLIVDLAAEEAAVAASLCCDGTTGFSDMGDESASDRRERMAETVLASRPGLDYLCINGPMPLDSDGRLVTETGVDFWASSNPDGHARGARLLEVQLRCETDGAVAPLRGLFPTITLEGRASEVTIFADGPRLTIAPAWANEGEDMVFTAVLSKPVDEDIALEYFTADGTATSADEITAPDDAVPDDAVPADADYAPIPADAPGLAVIHAGETEAEIRLTTFDDDVCEGDETFALMVSMSGSGPVPTVNDDDRLQFSSEATIVDDADCAADREP
ncbi:Calx-beta domain-containing protein [Candidatus Poriferisodalis sp.]|uniref:Calx-beta domain-containing protein n=1 Tax=Candidatus Poriferisodalis sp. TaxID=3101277 RepID=UPI003B01276B